MSLLSFFYSDSPNPHILLPPGHVYTTLGGSLDVSDSDPMVLTCI